MSADIEVAEGIQVADLERLIERIKGRHENHEIWTAEEVANHLRVSRRTLTERYATKPWFPQPFRLPSESGRGGNLRWWRKDIEAFVAEQAGKPA